MHIDERELYKIYIYHAVLLAFYWETNIPYHNLACRRLHFTITIICHTIMACIYNAYVCEFYICNIRFLRILSVNFIHLLTFVFVYGCVAVRASILFYYLYYLNTRKCTCCKIIVALIIKSKKKWWQKCFSLFFKTNSKIWENRHCQWLLWKFISFLLPKS